MYENCDNDETRNRTKYIYDTLNRLLSRTPDPTTGEPTVSFTYTATGKRQTMTDASGTTNYTYDSMDRLHIKATPEGTLTYEYDAASHLQTMTSSNTNGVSVSYTYDSLNRLSTVVDARLSGSQTTTYGYDPASNVASVTYPNTVQYAFNYDALNRLKQIATGQTGYLYTFDNAGNRKTVSELSNRAVSWTYDGINRLTNETISLDPNNKNGSASYGLDAVGNRQTATSSIPGLSPVGGSFTNDDELTSEGYDQDGNVTASGGKTFNYDTENHLVSMNSGAVTIVYDGDGNRVKKIVGGVTTQYLVDDLNPTGYPQVVEELTNGAVSRTYTYGLQRISEAQSINGTWTPSFYGYDGFGTVRQLTSSTGAITDTFDFDSFGNEVHSTGTTPNVYLYRGEQYDSDLSLYYLRARYYNPITGRFMSRDPEAVCNCSMRTPSVLHKYSYANNDPVNLVDPAGRQAFAATVELDRGISLNPVVVAGVHATGVAIACALTWEGTKTYAYSVAGTSGDVEMVAPCIWMAKLPHIPTYGDRPAPFYPDDVITTPGTPWKCESEDECEAPCPPGSKRDHQKLHRDPGKWGEPPHWDWTDCNGDTWKIYGDGTMGPG